MLFVGISFSSIDNGRGTDSLGQEAHVRTNTSSGPCLCHTTCSYGQSRQLRAPNFALHRMPGQLPTRKDQQMTIERKSARRREGMNGDSRRARPLEVLAASQSLAVRPIVIVETWPQVSVIMMRITTMTFTCDRMNLVNKDSRLSEGPDSTRNELCTACTVDLGGNG